MWVLSGVCVAYGPCGPNFRVLFRSEQGQNISIYRSLSIFLKIVHWPIRNFIYKFGGATFVSMWRGPEAQISPLGRQIDRIQVFEYFDNYFPVDLHQSCFLCLLELLSEMCTIWESKVQFFGPQKVPACFTSVLFHMFLGATFRSVWTIGLRGPISGPFWAQK